MNKTHTLERSFADSDLLNDPSTFVEGKMEAFALRDPIWGAYACECYDTASRTSREKRTVIRAVVIFS